MSAGLLDGSCGGIMYACCQRKDAKAISSSADYNTITSDETRELLQPQLAQDTDTANGDRKFIPALSNVRMHTHLTNFARTLGKRKNACLRWHKLKVPHLIDITHLSKEIY